MKCFLCGEAFGSMTEAMSHIKSEYLHKEKSAEFKLDCFFKTDGNCTQQFLSYYSLERHCVQQHHQAPAGKRKLCESTSSGDTNSQQIPSVKQAKIDSPEPSAEVAFRAVQDATQSIFSQMEAVGISKAQQSAVAEGLLKLVSSAGQYARSNVKSNLDVPLEALDTSTNRVLQSIETFRSSHLRQKYYSSLPTYVAPIEKAISLKTQKIHDRAEGVEKEQLNQTSFQYVSIKDTLKTFFKIPEFRELWFNPSHICQPGIYYDICCAQNCQESEFHQKNRFAGRCQLYYDECDPCDGMKSRSGVNKLGMFYIKWHNIDPALRSRSNNSQLAALVYYDDIKKGKYSKNLMFQ